MEKHYLQVFFELRKLGNNLIQLESHQEFLKKCHEAKSSAKDFTGNVMLHIKIKNYSRFALTFKMKHLLRSKVKYITLLK